MAFRKNICDYKHYCIHFGNSCCEGYGGPEVSRSQLGRDYNAASARIAADGRRICAFSYFRPTKLDRQMV